ncbi:hypothetical protein SETIT_5G375600v2 [Setaria italica]|uniref:Uncharacterized protein n=1 Tax=Setaria italica TaxID=4555 RepID=A0A368RDB0_SETIT|nr:hypothetical protein SETIT_5G375600v2 [Setaria italica]
MKECHLQRWQLLKYPHGWWFRHPKRRWASRIDDHRSLRRPVAHGSPGGWRRPPAACLLAGSSPSLLSGMGVMLEELSIWNNSSPHTLYVLQEKFVSFLCCRALLSCIAHLLWSTYHNFELLLAIHACALFSGEVSSNVHVYMPFITTIFVLL